MKLNLASALTLPAALALAPFTVRAAETAPAPVVAAPAEADAKNAGTKYYRYETTAGKKGDLELLTREFHNAKTGKTVTLAGMIHIADAAYYRKIDALADKQDVVLLEGVKGGGAGVITLAPLLYQMSLGPRLLAPANLAGQMDHLRGEGLNRRNADVDASELGEGGGGLGGVILLPVVVALGETAYTLEGLAEQFARLTGNEDGMTALTRAKLAEELTTAGDEKDGNPTPKGGEDFERIIIGRRNDAVLKVLDEELGKPAVRTVLVPWGAEHNTGLEKALIARGFVLAGDTWNTAIAVKSLNTSPDTTPGFRYRFPYLLSIRNSDTGFEFDAPLSLITAYESPRINGGSIAWGLLHFGREDDTSVFAADALGILRLRTENKNTGERSKDFLLGLYGESSLPEKDSVHLGWWGFLGGATDLKEDGRVVSSEWHLPISFGKRPLFYGQKTDEKTGETEHRFLLFFKTTSGR